MAIRLTSASSQSLSRTASVPTLTAYTACGWTSRVSNASYGTLVALENTGAGAYLNLQMDSTTTGLICFLNGGGSFTCGTKALNTPFFFAVTCSGLTTGLVKVYIRAATSNVFESYASAGSISTFTSVSVKWGVDQSSEVYDGTLWNAKCWDRALTASELLVESYYRRTMFPASLNFHWPLDNASNLTTIDQGPNNRPPTLAGTPTIAHGPYGLWTPSRRTFLPIAAGGGGFQPAWAMGSNVMMQPGRVAA